MTAIFYIIEGVLILGGSLFIALAAVGIIRLPDLYTRMHSASKAGAVGSGFLLLALAFNSSSTPETLRALAAIVFFLLTTPIAAHLLGKASYAVGYKLWPGSVLDEMPEVEPSAGKEVAAGRPQEEFFRGKADEPAWRRDRRGARQRWSDLGKK
ncbi:monovalent cation/H(+) antiporter subunit G [Fulvimarina sp. 2208YS6-2-32]|uniref:Monovalent cation/H(+) antiporter subunit G n=1 Tax=Fulvimarina uroteuthidis TaxID=3098149 RepID=A0ABU5HZ15_9HYPH|nr:monovalent cation/H(+) antiporter subunit G [Fulvimarina sp. 2208YS6-2-32]MDY8108364.1 monovalent cation/H(+) antiporter subunit G [Fulvimarina sp. 2208YS6-2-32]